MNFFITADSAPVRKMRWCVFRRLKFEAASLPAQASREHTCVARHYRDWSSFLALEAISGRDTQHVTRHRESWLCPVTYASPVSGWKHTHQSKNHLLDSRLFGLMDPMGCGLAEQPVFAGWTLFDFFEAFFIWRNYQFRGRRLANNNNVVFYVFWTTS